MKKKTTLKKPTLNTDAALQFAESEPEAVQGHQKANASKTVPGTEKRDQAANGETKFRLTMNIKKSVHLKLKLNAARQDITMTELIESLVNEHLDD